MTEFTVPVNCYKCRWSRSADRR